MALRRQAAENGIVLKSYQLSVVARELLCATA